MNDDGQRGREDLLRIFVRNTPAAVAMVDRDLRYLLHSERWCTDYHLPDTDLVGRLHYEVFPEIPERWKAIHRRVLEGHAERAVEDRFERSDGSVDWVSWECLPWRDERGQVGGMILFTEVVTERVHAREERRRLEERMRETQRLESLGVLAGGVAHDFNNLLVGILGNAGLALDQLPPDTPAAESIRAVEQAARRAADMTRQLLAFAGRGRVELEPLDASRLVEETLDLVRAGFAPGVVLRTSLAPDLPAVQGDRALLGQVVMNLLTNAAEALGGGGELRVATWTAPQPPGDLPWVQPLEPGARGPFVAIEVRDAGSGMEPDTARRIFDPFYSTKSAGRGLGLATALGTVGAHRGGIQMDSAPGEGAVFRVVLPASGPGPAAATGPAPPSPAAAEGATVLVVDDEAMVRDLARRALEGAGFRVCEAAGGEEALKGLEDGSLRADAVLLDLTMPGLSGAAVLRELRQLRPGLPVVLTSGYAADRVADTGTPGAADAFLQKPFRPRDLVAALNDVLERA